MTTLRVRTGMGIAIVEAAETREEIEAMAARCSEGQTMVHTQLHGGTGRYNEILKQRELTGGKIRIGCGPSLSWEIPLKIGSNCTLFEFVD